jgi:hypothetical protein
MLARLSRAYVGGTVGGIGAAGRDYAQGHVLYITIENV